MRKRLYPRNVEGAPCALPCGAGQSPPDIQDTIVALATPRGGAARAVVRLSGPRAWEIAARFCDAEPPARAAQLRPSAADGMLALPAFPSRIACTLLRAQSPRSFTGQDLVELHTIGCLPVVDALISACVTDGARLAMPGEFTMRAFLAGKMDLTRAEAIAGLVDATSPRLAAAALRQMAGGIARPIEHLRERFLDLLAELEAGLDFAEEDLDLSNRAEIRGALLGARTELGELGDQMRERTAAAGESRRAVLLGAPNAGKSSLFNALLERDAALVSRRAGTTRDYLVGELRLGTARVELVDTAGIGPSSMAVESIERKAAVAREGVSASAELVLWCSAAAGTGALESRPAFPADQPVLFVATKCDLANSAARAAAVEDAVIATSARTGQGLLELREAIARWTASSGAGEPTVVAGTAARCRHAVEQARVATERALDALDGAASDELIALELRLALDELGQVVGAVCTNDLLDRIFSRFCIGK